MFSGDIERDQQQEMGKEADSLQKLTNSNKRGFNRNTMIE